MTGFQITLTDDARDFLAGHQNALTLRTSPRHGCCGGTVFLPIVEPGRTRGSEAWPVIEQDDIRIYVEPGLTVPAHTELRVDIDRLLLMTRLWIEGLPTSM